MSAAVIEKGSRPLADGSPPEWATGWGEDRFGIFVEFSIGDVTQIMRWIRPGRFLIGSPEDEPGRYADEGPRHEVTIGQGFWLFDTLCTQDLWTVVMGENPSGFRSSDRPVERVSWNDVQMFLARINERMSGLDLALPSEAQWEYACRSGTETALYTGDIAILGVYNAPALDPIAWYGGNSGVDFELDDGFDNRAWKEKQYPYERAGTRLVKRKRPNRWGLYDMLGNVWEWCADEWHHDYQDAPTDGTAWVDTEATDARRVLRGGSWRDGARNVRSAYRYGNHPDARDVRLGFRCARVQS